PAMVTSSTRKLRCCRLTGPRSAVDPGVAGCGTGLRPWTAGVAGTGLGAAEKSHPAKSVHKSNRTTAQRDRFIASSPEHLVGLLLKLERNDYVNAYVYADTIAPIWPAVNILGP